MRPNQVVTSLVIALLLAVGGARVSQGGQDAKGRVPAATPVAPVNLNAATAPQLEALPGIGPKTAQLIIDYRNKNGGFKKIEELMNIRGVGEKSFLRIKDLVTVTPPKATDAATVAKH